MKAVPWVFAGVFAIAFFWNYVHPRSDVWSTTVSPQNAEAAAKRDIQDELNLQYRKRAEAVTETLRKKGLPNASQTIQEELTPALRQFHEAVDAVNNPGASICNDNHIYREGGVVMIDILPACQAGFKPSVYHGSEERRFKAELLTAQGDLLDVNPTFVNGPGGTRADYDPATRILTVKGPTKYVHSESGKHWILRLTPIQ
jgi:hypothetical protein